MFKVIISLKTTAGVLKTFWVDGQALTGVPLRLEI